MKGAPSIHRAAAVLAGIALLPLLRIDAFPPELAGVIWGIVVWRCLAVDDGRALIGRRVRVVLDAVAALIGVFFLYALAGGGTQALVALLALVAVLQSLCLLRRQAPFVTFLVLVLANTHAAGSAFLRKDVVALVLALAYLMLLVGVLVLFERRTREMQAESRSGAVDRRRIGGNGGNGGMPRPALFRAIGGLLALGCLAGLLVYGIAPRGSGLRRKDDAERAAGRGEDAITDDGSRVEGLPFLTGPSATSRGIRLGDIGQIKRDLTPFFEVTLPPGRSPWLRENTYARYRSGDWGVWKSGAEAVPERLLSKAGQGGWVDLGRDDDPARGFDVEIVQLRGSNLRLFLERDAVRMRLLRGGRAMLLALLRYSNEQIDMADIRLPLLEGDTVQERVVPPVRDWAALEAARCDAGIAPHEGFLQFPDECRPLTRIAEGLVAGESRAWRRARLLVDWLKSDTFTYTLRMPEVDGTRPVVDFVVRRREGHCEYFASALTLMLRSLGHPARIVRGFRGGDYQPERGTWIVRGSNYHAWTEMYFEGLGWIPLDATPPDNEAADVGTVTRVADERASSEPAVPWTRRFLEYGAEERAAVFQAIGGFLDRFVLRPLAFLFGRGAFFAGELLVSVLAFWMFRRRRRDRAARNAGLRAGARLPDGPYGRALHLLARRGLRRRATWTAREFGAALRRLHPDTADHLEPLTALYEEERFAGRPPGREEIRRARAALAGLEASLQPARR